MDKYTACTGSTLYNEKNKEVARDVEITLPAVTFQTAEFKALGTVNVPIAQLVDDMEMSIKHIGEAREGFDLLKPGAKKIEARWARSVFKNNGTVKTVGCRAALTVCPKVAAPELGIVVGENTECDLPFSVLRYKLYVDGKEVILVDKLKGICKVDGKDFAEEVNSVL